ncbi:MAG: hypothetical protein KDK38_06920 [Leptospiraceae bacterium]|nr:hypothetical protein [Leptospiraceae bacterium]
MEIWLLISVIAGTAFLSSALTAYITYRLADRMYDIKVEKRIDQLPAEIGAEVEKGVKDAAESLLPEFEERVRNGFRSSLKDATRLGPELTSSAIEASLEAGIKSVDMLFKGPRRSR